MKRTVSLGLLALTAAGAFAVDTYIMRVPVEGAVPSDIRYEIKDEVLVRDDYGHTDWTTNDGLTRFMTYFEDWEYQRTGYQVFNGVEKMVSKEIYADTRPFTVTEEIPFNRADWSIKSFDNCGTWSPDPSMVSQGEEYEQSSTCDVLIENQFNTQKTIREAVSRLATGTSTSFYAGDSCDDGSIGPDTINVLNDWTGFNNASHNWCTMTTLNLNGYGINSVPDEVGALTELNYLHLQNNTISSLPSSIGNLEKLRYLNVAHNRITTLPDSIGRLSALSQIIANNNNLATLPDSIGNLTALTKLTINHNGMTSMPGNIGNLVNLREFIVHNNSLSTVPESIGNLNKVATLYLHSNEINSLPSTIGGMDSLNRINVGKNNLVALPATLGDITGLKFLYFPGNNISEIPSEFSNLTNLLVLHGSGNNISEFPEFISQVTSLTQIWLDGNRIQSIPNSINNLNNLSYLQIHSNPGSQFDNVSCEGIAICSK